MNGQINAARHVTKTNTSQVETFRSLEFGQLGVAEAETVRFYRAPLRRQTLALSSPELIKLAHGGPARLN
jgi:L-asparaginase